MKLAGFVAHAVAAAVAAAVALEELAYIAAHRRNTLAWVLVALASGVLLNAIGGMLRGRGEKST